MSALLRVFSVPIGTPTSGDGVVLASANSVLRLALAPREPVPPTAAVVAGHRHDRRADDENAAYIWVLPSSRRRSPSPSADPAISRTARLLLCKPLHHPAGCRRVRTRGMVYARSGMRTPRFRDANANPNGHRHYRPPSVAAVATPTQLVPSNWHYPQQCLTQTTHHRSSTRPRK